MLSLTTVFVIFGVMLISECVIGFGFIWDLSIKPSLYDKIPRKISETERTRRYAKVNRLGDKIYAAMYVTSFLMSACSVIVLLMAGIPHSLSEFFLVTVPYIAMAVSSGQLWVVFEKQRRRRLYDANKLEKLIFVTAIGTLGVYAVIYLIGICYIVYHLLSM